MTDVLILLALSVVAVALLRRIHLPPILGYLFVGIIAGPHTLGWLPGIYRGIYVPYSLCSDPDKGHVDVLYGHIS